MGEAKRPDGTPVHGFDSDATPLVGARRGEPAPDRIADELAPGDELGGHVIEARRGAGGFATVYRARRIATGEAVAIKVLHAHLGRTPRIVLRFRREAELISRLAHPGIVRLLDHGEHAGRPYLVMAWADGATLAEVLRDRGPLALDEVIPIIAALADALDAAHARGIVHRDLKAANVVIAERGVILLDFGIAKLLAADHEHGITTAGTRLGTPDYMAPEQIAGGAIDHRADVYALGVLVFELLTGRRPFEGGDPIEIEERQLREAPPRASQLAAVAPAIDDALGRAMAKDPGRRHSSAAALVAELRAANGAPAPAGRAVALYVHAGARHEDADDAALDRLEREVGRVRQAAIAAGLELAADAGRSWLFVGAPGDGSLRAVIDGLEQLAHAALAAVAHPDVVLALTIHAVEHGGREVEPSTLLLALARWTRTDASSVVVSPAAQAARA